MTTKNKTDKKIEVLSLFSGGGFLDIGFVNQGFQIKEAVEIDEKFIAAYNSGMSSYFEKSSNQWVSKKIISHTPIQSSSDASNTDTQDRLVKEHFKITGIIGGPPCQDYSIGGKNAGIEGEKGRLIHSYFQIIEKVQPSFLFFENVAGLIRTKRHKVGFDAFLKDLEGLGYTVWYDLLNAIDYGIPQDRPRVALVGFKNHIVNKLIKSGYVLEKDNKRLYNENDQFVFRWPKKKYENIKLQKWPTKNSFGCGSIAFPLETKYSELTVEKAFGGLSKNTPNQNEFFQPKSGRFQTIEEGDTNRKSFKRLHRHRFSPTVAYGNNEVHLHPTEPRRLTVREGLRLQSVPDEYVLPEDIPLTAKFKLISNGVPTQKAELIAKEIRRTLQNFMDSTSNQ